MSGNTYQQSANDPKATQSSLLGPAYNYSAAIKSTDQLGISSKGDLETLGKDVQGLFAYTNLLTGDGNQASVTGKPLGNKYFMKTGGQCTATDTQKSADRYIYINNVPTGGNPGLISGIIQNIEGINPFALMGAFMSSDTPKCMPITMQTIDVDNNQSQDTQYVALAEVRAMDPSTFPGGSKPSVPEGFVNYSVTNDPSVQMPDDMIIQLYFACLAAIGVYILYRMYYFFRLYKRINISYYK
jgi:hypothetical protein